MRVIKGETYKLNVLLAPTFVPVGSNVTYQSSNASVATVDANGVVTGIKKGTATITATANGIISSCKIHVLDAEIAPLNLYDKSANKTNYIVNSIGDSITTYVPNPDGGMQYHKYWSQWYNITNNNYGVSGTTINPRSGSTDSFLERYSSMRDDADLVTVKGGTNDWVSRIPLGTSTTRSTTTFKGSVRMLMEGLIEKYPDKHIVFFTPIKRCDDDRTPESVNGNGDTVKDFADAVIEIGKQYGIPVIDIYTPDVVNLTNLGPYDNYEELIPDGLHPSGLGHEILGEYMMEQLLEIGVFKDVTDEQVELDIDFDEVEHYVYTADELITTATYDKCIIESELRNGYLRIYTDEATTDTNTYVTFNFENLGADFLVKNFKYVLVSYKTNVSSAAPWNMSVLIKRDGQYSRHWGMNYQPTRDVKKQYAILPLHTLITAGQKEGYNSYDDIDDDSIIKEFRLKPWGSGDFTPSEGEYLDIEYIAFFDEAYLANAYLVKEKTEDTENISLGDINEDGVITTVDAVHLARVISNWTGYAAELSSADINGDGEIGTTDLIILSRHLSNWTGYETIPLN